jgi:hypothetical protein
MTVVQHPHFDLRAKEMIFDLTLNADHIISLLKKSVGYFW